MFVGVASGGTVSNAFTLSRTDRAIALLVPSLAAASAVYIQFAVTSGGPGFADVARGDGSGHLHAVYSGAGPGVGTAVALTRYGRVSFATAAAQATSLAVFAVLR
jgi:hypothetical protein